MAYTINQLARLSRVSTRTLRFYDEIALLKPAYYGDNDELSAFIDKHPDAYLNEVAAHFQVTIPCVSIALKRLKITRKKRVNFIKKERI